MGNLDGVEQAAPATEAPRDSQEVQKTEDLYAGVQEALASVQPQAEGQEPEAEEGQAESQDDQRGSLSEQTVSRLEAVATGSALDQYLASASEYAMNGWRVEGKSTLVGTPRITDATYLGQPAKILEVCLDSSQVAVLDSAGNHRSAGQSTRSLNIFTLIEDQGEWKIASQDFPDNADC